jgi:zinc/manganese transport system permease protein
MLSVVFALLVTWVGLGISYFSIYPLGFFVTSLGFGLYALAQLGRYMANRLAREARPSKPKPVAVV